MTGGVGCYMERVGKHLAPCLAQLSVAAHKESYWKVLNRQLLLMSRHTDPQVCDSVCVCVCV